MEKLVQWFKSHADALGALGAAWIAVGVASLIVTVVTLPIVIVRLPADYFVRDRRIRLASMSQHRVVAWMLITLKNLLGLALFVLGAVMLFVPGQGILTMLIGLLLMNFPGKYRLEQKLVRRPAVLRTLNRVRARWNRAPLEPPPAPD